MLENHTGGTGTFQQSKWFGNEVWNMHPHVFSPRIQAILMATSSRKIFQTPFLGMYVNLRRWIIIHKSEIHPVTMNISGLGGKHFWGGQPSCAIYFRNSQAIHTTQIDTSFRVVEWVPHLQRWCLVRNSLGSLDHIGSSPARENVVNPIISNRQ